MKKILSIILFWLATTLSAQNLSYNIEMNGVASNGD